MDSNFRNTNIKDEICIKEESLDFNDDELESDVDKNILENYSNENQTILKEEEDLFPKYIKEEELAKDSLSDGELRINQDEVESKYCEVFEEESVENTTKIVMDSQSFYGKHRCNDIPADSEISESNDEEVDISSVRVLELDEEFSEIIEVGELFSRTYNEGASAANFSDVLQTPSTSHDKSEVQLPQTSENAEARGRPKKKASRIYWRDGVPEEPKLCQWKGISKEPTPAKSPFEYFEYYFNKDLLDLIVRESNLFSMQSDTNKSLHLTVEEFKQFLGTVIYMSCSHLANTRIADVLSRSRWQEIKKYLHFNDNDKELPKDHERYDRLFKIRPFLDHFQRKVQRIPTSEFLSFDEQMIPLKGHHPRLQYAPKKPKEYGYKVFVLADCSGIVYNFEIYTGKIVKSEEFEDIGASGNIVLKLCAAVPRMQNYKLCFNNWFTSINLVAELNKIGIQSLGTACQNRIPNVNFPADKQMKRMGRGSVAIFSADVDEANITTVKYFDKRSVIFLTTYAPVHPIIEEIKYERAEKKDVPVKVPEIVRIYNRHMVGVDNLDKMIALYRCNIRSRKWYLRIFFYFVDMFCTSAWFEYKKDYLADGVPEKKLLGLLDFKIEIAEQLCKGRKAASRKRGSPSGSFEREYKEKKTDKDDTLLRCET